MGSCTHTWHLILDDNIIEVRDNPKGTANINFNLPQISVDMGQWVCSNDIAVKGCADPI